MKKCAGWYLCGVIMMGCMTFHHFLKKKESAAVEKGSADIKIKFIVAMRIQKDFFFWRRD